MYEALVEIVARIGAPREVFPGDDGVRTRGGVFSEAAGEEDERHVRGMNERVGVGTRVQPSKNRLCGPHGGIHDVHVTEFTENRARRTSLRFSWSHRALLNFHNNQHGE